MIPRTFPSIFEDSKTKCVVFVLPSISGLKAWTDYIPVKGITTENTAVENTYANDGYIVMKTVDGTQKAWIDYIPVYEDASYTKPWSTDVGGYIPASGLFSIRGTLFGNNEPGVWYDPSDTSTLFQDAAGTTPVTAVEQPVGLMLDKSRGLVLGSELVTNGDFSNGTTGWAGQSNVALSVENGELKGVASTSESTYAYQDTVTVPGKLYKATATVRAVSGKVRLSAWNGGFSTRLAYVDIITTTNRQVTIYFNATGTSTRVAVGLDASPASTYYSDNISVRELPGNHAFQSVATTSRPVLSSRYNLLTKTEDFGDGVWSKFNATITANAATNPFGNNTASLMQITANGVLSGYVRQNTSQPASTTVTQAVWAKKGTANFLQISNAASTAGNFDVWFDLNTGVVGVKGAGNTASMTEFLGGWYLCVATFPTAATISNNLTDIRVARTNGSNTVVAGDSIYIWGASLVPTNQASLPYQRVNTSTDYDADATKFPRYLRFDGSDDWLQTGTITPGTDKVQVFAGVRKLSDAAAGILAEFGPVSTTAGVFSLFASGGTSNRSWAWSTAQPQSFIGTADLPAPVTATMSAIMDRSAANAAQKLGPRLNGATPTLSDVVEAAATGNFLAYPLYIGRRGGTSNPFNGHLYSLTVRFGPNLDAATIANAEKYVAGKTGVTL
jgi:hypothetical protein